MANYVWMNATSEHMRAIDAWDYQDDGLEEAAVDAYFSKLHPEDHRDRHRQELTNLRAAFKEISCKIDAAIDARINVPSDSIILTETQEFFRNLETKYEAEYKKVDNLIREELVCWPAYDRTQ